MGGNMYWKFLIIISFFSPLLFAQEDMNKEVTALTKELSEMEKKYYLWLRKRVRDVWPYVKVAVEEYNSIQDTSQYFTNKREKRKYIKNRQEVLANQFEEQLKELSLSRGQILIKLIHRETNKTSFEIIKELRGGMNAFLWNSAGGAFDLDLKTEFDPAKTREDLYIQVILQKDFHSGRLQPIKESY